MHENIVYEIQDVTPSLSGQVVTLWPLLLQKLQLLTFLDNSIPHFDRFVLGQTFVIKRGGLANKLYYILHILNRWPLAFILYFTKHVIYFDWSLKFIMTPT